MTQIVNTSGIYGPATDFSSVLAVINVGTDGTYVAVSGGSGGGVPSVNSITSAVTIAGAGGVSVTTAGSTITVSGSSSGGVSGPGSNTNQALAVWNGTGGNLLENSPILMTSQGNLTMPNGGGLGAGGGGVALSVVGSSGLTLGGGTQPITAISTITGAPLSLTSTGNLVLQSLTGNDVNINTGAAGGNVNISGNGVEITGNNNVQVIVGGVTAISSTLISNSLGLNTNLQPGVIFTPSSSINNNVLGTSLLPFSGIVANNYITTRVSGTVSAATTVINWNAGASQILTFINGNPISTNLLFSGMNAGSSYMLETNQNASGTGVLTWSAPIKWQQGISGTMTASGNATDLFSFYSNGTNVYANAGFNFK